jgi:hypothetical protein
VWTVFVADRYNHRVQAFTRDGALLRVLGSGCRSVEPGHFAEPFGCECGHGTLIVSEWHGHRVQVLTPHGEPLQELSIPRAEMLGGLCLLPDERLLLVLEPMVGLLHVLSCDTHAAPQRDVAATGVAAAVAAAPAPLAATADCICPITMRRMHDPVVTADGHTYERAAIERWLRQHDTSPMTGQPLANKVLSPDGAVHQRRQALNRLGEA